MTSPSLAPDRDAGLRRPWDALGNPPRSRVRASVAERLFRHAVRDLPVRIALAGGERLGAGGPGDPLMRVERPSAFFQRLGTDTKIGFGEAYMAGDWTSPDPAAVLTPFAARMASLIPKPFQLARRWVDAQQSETERGTIAAARRDIGWHYDLSNEVFATFLDDTMTYSGAWFPPGSDDLDEAQQRKLNSILDMAGVGPGTRLLEIGTGWGSLAVRAARRGAEVTTVTLSLEQQQLADQHVHAAGLADRVSVRRCDYREVHGRYDAIVSVEMLEAVGRRYWSTYFAALERLLAPGGRVAIQTITMPHHRMLATRRGYTWIHKYIFPGGQLPSIEAINTAVAEHTALCTTERHSFGASYAQTLRHWRERFNRRWSEIATLGFSERFRRTWEFYLAYSEAGFRSGYLDAWQLGYRADSAG